MKICFVTAKMFFIAVAIFSFYNLANSQGKSIDCYNDIKKCNLDFEVFLVDADDKNNRTLFSKNEVYNLKIYVTNNSESNAFFMSTSEFAQFSFVLEKDNNIYKYLPDTEDRVNFLNNTQPISSRSLTVKSHKSKLLEIINLKDWYNDMESGEYSLTIKYRPRIDQSFLEIGRLIFRIQ